MSRYDIGSGRQCRPDLPAACDAAQAHFPHQPGHRAPGNSEAFAVELLPDLAGAIHPVVLFPHPPDLGPELLIPDRSRWQAARIPLSCLPLVVRRRGDRQYPADRLDPEAVPVIVDVT